MPKRNVNDLVQTVNLLTGQPGVGDKVDVHRWPCQLHRASSVWLFRRAADGQLETLLQQRSLEKFTGGGWWGNAVCGNLIVGESHEACAHRRLREEVGVTNVQLRSKGNFVYRAFCNLTFGEYELDEVFVGEWNETCVLNAAEVSAVTWVNWTVLSDWAKSVRYPTAEQTVEMSQPELRDQVSARELVTAEGSLWITPWSILMARFLEL